jgi:hypothetical protein
MTIQTSYANARETFANEDVLKMVTSGLPAIVIVSKIKTLPGTYDVSTDTLISLSKSGVPGSVLVAMLEAGIASNADLSEDSGDPGVPHYPGVYMFGSQEQRMVRITATASNQSKTSGSVGYLLTGGILASSVKASVPSRNAIVQSLNKQPVFYMFFDKSVPRAAAVGSSSVWQTNNGSVTTSPAELSLVRFRDKSGKREAQSGRREARVGSQSILGAKQGVMNEDRIDFETEQVRPGVFKVTPSRPLQVGEYGFIQTLQGVKLNGNGASAMRVYDFGISE